MHDIQVKLDLKSMSDLTIKTMQDIYDTKNSTEQKKEEYKRWADNGFVYIREDFSLKFIKNAGQVNHMNTMLILMIKIMS